MHLVIRLGLVLAVVAVIGGAALAGLSAGRERTINQREREGASWAPAGVGEAPDIDQQIADLQARLARTGDNPRTYTTLGFAYLQKARESGDPSYYGRAETALTTSLALDGSDADTFVDLGTLALARHNFEQALTFGERARELNPYKSAAYGVAGDALVELGRYDEARATIQAMVDLRPDLTSYARVSYLRELFGDVPGAVAAMQLAVNAGAPGSEAHAWTQVQLGHLAFNTGDLGAAAKAYERTLVQRPGYLHARAGIARVKAARGDVAGAAAMYEAITREMPLPEYAIALADLYRAAGRTTAADEAEALVLVLDRLFRDNGVNTDVEMALFRVDRGIDLPETVEQARRAHAVRPSIHTADALAWALFQAGHADDAEPYAREALRLGTRDPLKHYHAGLIAEALGRTDAARWHLAQALAINPSFSLLHAAQARSRLAALDGTAASETTRSSR